MRYIKIEHNLGEESAINCANALREAGVKQARRGAAVLALSTMHNAHVIINIMVDNYGFEREEPSQADIDYLNRS